ALLLLSPATPMLFQGQEFSASSPFLYFADFEDELAAAVRAGRGEFLTQFPSMVNCERQGVLDAHAGAYALHADLLRLRREHLAFCAPRTGGVDGAVLSTAALALRFFTPDHLDDRLLIVNLGADFARASIAEPLIAPPPGTDWMVH